MLSKAKEGIPFLLSSLYDKDEVWDKIPARFSSRSLTRNSSFTSLMR